MSSNIYCWHWVDKSIETVTDVSQIKWIPFPGRIIHLDVTREDIMGPLHQSPNLHDPQSMHRSFLHSLAAKIPPHSIHKRFLHSSNNKVVVLIMLSDIKLFNANIFIGSTITMNCFTITLGFIFIFFLRFCRRLLWSNQSMEMCDWEVEDMSFPYKKSIALYPF